MKKISSLIVGGMISALLLCSCNSSYPAPSEVDDLSLSFPRVMNTGKATLDNLKYNDNWFLESSYTYNEDLALISMILNFSDFDPKNEEGAPETNKVYEALGFKSESTYIVKEDENNMFSFPFTIASKTIQPKESAAQSIVSVNLRYGGYGNGGWKGDFAIGAGEKDVENVDNKIYHLGFYESAKYVTNAVESYLETNKFDIPNTKIWLSGYSKGAGVSDIASILLREDSNIDASNIYTYSAATPAYTTSTKNDSSLDNIHNLLNYSDVATCVPFDTWGFKIAGHNVFVPTINDSNKDKFEKNVHDISGIAFSGLYDYTTIISNIKNIITKSYPTRKDYGLLLQPVVEHAFSDDEGITEDYSYFDNILSCENTIEDAKVQPIKDYLATLDFNDSDGQMTALSYVDNILETAKEYWVDKGSINGDILSAILSLLSEAVNFFFEYSDSEKPEDYVYVQTIQSIKDMLSLGRQAPIYYQHYPEIYVARLLLNK